MESSNTSQLRSASLPSKLNPSCSRIEISLNKLKKLVPLYSSTHIHSGLVCLIDLYVSVDELIGSSQTQNVNLQYRNKALVEDALDRSTRLMDSYSNLVELLAQMKENVRALQFALRRKGISTYASIEEQLERETESYLVAGEDHHLSTVIGVLIEVVVATISVFRYILLILSSKPKLDKGFLLIAKLITTSKPNCHKSQEIDNDADIIDLTLDSLSKDIKKNECKTVEVQMVTERLHKLDRQIEGYEVGLDSLFRKLIQTRVSLLNILAN
ncbi:hypothetical protein L1987_05697 [Smallanthus sonchifolius]|uniref:Uncharacterized protein n=1 Tax=Smallanthus sonchifolius TaxID=185202 RepID=A0ACB9JW25_9ASTR|nr:hypothetical protein L1987_05697 [Smallanthus sonchifolius]